MLGKSQSENSENGGWQGHSYRDLLGMASVRRWYRNLARGSPASADVYLKAMARFCRDTGMDPERLLEMEDGEPQKPPS